MRVSAASTSGGIRFKEPSTAHVRIVAWPRFPRRSKSSAPTLLMEAAGALARASRIRLVVIEGAPAD
jgi:hypothetical protein